MRRILSLTSLMLLISANYFAQAVLPTTWSFATTTLPTGWTESGTAFYTASGNTPPAMKFDGTGDFMIINFASNPGNLTYFLTGNSFAGGTFTVEESEFGVTYTTLHAFTAPPAGTYTQFTDVPLASTRYIRFIYTNKVSGNIGLDDVNIDAGAATPSQEINILQGSTTILSGGTQLINSAVGTATPTAFTVENLGTLNTLNITSATLSGTAAADYSVTSFPTSVAAGANAPLIVSFNPSVSGNRNAILTIANDDADESSYVINLYGVGGSYASEPTVQPTNLVFSNVKTYRLKGTFTPAAGVEGYLVLRKKGSAITGLPADGTVYQRGDIVGDAQVVFSANNSSFIPNNIIASSDYYFAVFAYNGTGTFINYLTTSPLTGNVTTPATMQSPTYYNGISTSSSTFLTDLHNLINAHQMQFYSNYGPLVVKEFASRDTTLNRRVITCVYSGENKIYTEPFDFTGTGFSREHTYCHSWMPTNPAQNLPEYNDYHHLFPTNQNSANGVRSNYPLGVVVTVQNTYLGAKFGLDANGKTVYEPRDSHKGDAARAMMYEATCYTTVSGNSWALPSYISSSIPYGQDQAILKQWHFQDLPDSWEITRNDFIDSLQNNRNPFVDSADFVCYINFSNMTYQSAGCLAAVEELLSKNFVVYPNPAKTTLTLHVDATTISHYEIMDLQGRTVASSDVNDVVLTKIDISSLNSGMYTVKALTPYGLATRSFVIE
ncbi:MAG: endonuclease [Crocinitomicaceae bacterium]